MSAPKDLLAFARLLLREQSITPDQSSCHQLIGERLEPLGFTIENLSFNGVNNLWAYLEGETRELFVFCGHTDVVPAGNESAWHYPPFGAQVKEDILYGRGAVDMKSSIAAMVVALEGLLPNVRPQKSIGLLITADEEGPARYGVKSALAALHKRGVKIHYCLVGEPTSEKQCGDTIKNGRRGSLGLTVLLRGLEGHSAYIASDDNVLHRLILLAQKLIDENWDALNERQDESASPTTFNITSIEGGSVADNMTAPIARMHCSWRSMLPPSLIQDRASSLLPSSEISWHSGAEAYFSSCGLMAEALTDAIQRETGIQPRLSTAGGTSDGRFFAPYETEVIEFGPCNTSMHQANEHISVAELKRLAEIYSRFCHNFLMG